MLFNSWQFLLFFPLVIIIFFLLPKQFKMLFILLASCIFYAVYKIEYIFILFFLILVDYCVGILIVKYHGLRKNFFLILSIGANLGILAFFKYFNFLHLNNLLNLNLSILLPLGLSFHTFQSLSYIIEVYKGKYKPEKNIMRYALYVMYFPQLVAGPIERPQHLLSQLKSPKNFKYLNITNGFKLMLWGLFKKMVIADRLAVIVDPIFADPTQQTAIKLVLAAYLFSFQIYCDFSGYCDIAIGASKILGIDLIKNFNYPYLATSVRDFWKRWHISLSSWFRDYLYIPLGGSRVNKWMVCINILIVFLLSGLWHGADWKFVVWGGLNGLFILIEIVLAKYLKFLKNWQFIKIFQIVLTFNIVSFAWIFFRADSLQTALIIINKIFMEFFIIPQSITKLNFNQPEIILTIGLIVFLELFQKIERYSDMKFLLKNQPTYLRLFIYYFLILSIIFLSENISTKFIYFQF